MIIVVLMYKSFERKKQHYISKVLDIFFSLCLYTWNFYANKLNDQRLRE